MPNTNNVIETLLATYVQRTASEASFEDAGFSLETAYADINHTIRTTELHVRPVSVLSELKASALKTVDKLHMYIAAIDGAASVARVRAEADAEQFRTEWGRAKALPGIDRAYVALSSNLHEPIQQVEASDVFEAWFVFVTAPIEIDGYQLGSLFIAFLFAEWMEDNDHHCTYVYRKSRTGATLLTDHVHPHVSDEGEPCFGNIESLVEAATASGSLSTVVALTQRLLDSYNEEGCYLALDDWPRNGTADEDVSEANSEEPVALEYMPCECCGTSYCPDVEGDEAAPSRLCTHCTDYRRELTAAPEHACDICLSVSGMRIEAGCGIAMCSECTINIPIASGGRIYALNLAAFRNTAVRQRLLQSHGFSLTGTATQIGNTVMSGVSRTWRRTVVERVVPAAMSSGSVCDCGVHCSDGANGVSPCIVIVGKRRCLCCDPNGTGVSAAFARAAHYDETQRMALGNALRASLGIQTPQVGTNEQR